MLQPSPPTRTQWSTVAYVEGNIRRPGKIPHASMLEIIRASKNTTSKQCKVDKATEEIYRKLFVYMHRGEAGIIDLKSGVMEVVVRCSLGQDGVVVVMVVAMVVVEVVGRGSTADGSVFRDIFLQESNDGCGLMSCAFSDILFLPLPLSFVSLL